jgi:fatty acid desaturase
MAFGLSGTWWQRNHNMHHAMPNRFHKDHDLDTMPLYAFNKIVVKRKKDGQNFFIQNQANLFLMASNWIGVMFWKIYFHPYYTIQKGDWQALFWMIVHWVWWLSTLGLGPYLITVWFTTNYYFGNFSLSHTHLPVTEQPQHWVEYAFNHTCDIEPSPWMDYWMGYLNYQIEHHLFPTMPQFRSGQICERVQAFAKKHDLPYTRVSYSEACSLTYGNMKKVAKELITA